MISPVTFVDDELTNQFLTHYMYVLQYIICTLYVSDDDLICFECGAGLIDLC